MNGPTKKADWVKVGDRVTSGRMEGEALRIIVGVTIPVVKVKWDNGHVGRMIITNLRKVEEADPTPEEFTAQRRSEIADRQWGFDAATNGGAW